MKRLIAVVIGVAWLGLAAPALGSSLGSATTPTTNSSTFAGYSIQGGGGGKFNTSATIVVPKLSCSGTTEKAIDANVGEYETTSTFSSAGVFIGCVSGKAQYFLSLRINGSNHNYQSLKPSPGDKVNLRVNQSTSSTFVQVADQTHKSVSKSLTAAGLQAGFPWVGDSGWQTSTVLAPPNFGTLHFSNAKLNGMAFGTAGGGALVRYNRVSGSTTVISTSGLTNQQAFTTTFK